MNLHNIQRDHQKKDQNTLGMQEMTTAILTILTDGEEEDNSPKSDTTLKTRGARNQKKHRRRKSKSGLLGMEGRKSSVDNNTNANCVVSPQNSTQDQQRRRQSQQYNAKKVERFWASSEHLLKTEPSEATLVTEMSHTETTLDTSNRSNTGIVDPVAVDAFSSSRRRSMSSASIADALGGSFAKWLKKGTALSSSNSKAKAKSNAKKNKSKLTFLSSASNNQHPPDSPSLFGSGNSISSYYQMHGDLDEGIRAQKVSSSHFLNDEDANDATAVKDSKSPKSITPPFEDGPLSADSNEINDRKPSLGVAGSEAKNELINNEGTTNESTEAPKHRPHRKRRESSRGHRKKTREGTKEIDPMSVSSRSHGTRQSSRARSKATRRESTRSPPRQRESFIHYPRSIRGTDDAPKEPPKSHKQHRSHNTDDSPQKERRPRRSKSSLQLLTHLMSASTPAAIAVPGSSSRRRRHHLAEDDDIDTACDTSTAQSHVPARSIQLDNSSQSHLPVSSPRRKRSSSANAIPGTRRRRRQRERHLSCMLSRIPTGNDGDDCDKTLDESRRERRRALRRDRSVGSSTAADHRRRRRTREKAVDAESSVPDLTLLKKESSHRSLTRESSHRSVTKESSQRNLLRESSQRSLKREVSHRSLKRRSSSRRSRPARNASERRPLRGPCRTRQASETRHRREDRSCEPESERRPTLFIKY